MAWAGLTLACNTILSRGSGHIAGRSGLPGRLAWLLDECLRPREGAGHLTAEGVAGCARAGEPSHAERISTDVATEEMVVRFQLELFELGGPSRETQLHRPLLVRVPVARFAESEPVSSKRRATRRDADSTRPDLGGSLLRSTLRLPRFDRTEQCGSVTGEEQQESIPE